MMIYRFKAWSGDGQLEGEVRAAGASQARRQILRFDPRLELRSLRWDAAATLSHWVDLLRPPPAREVAQFFRQFHLLFVSGIDPARGLAVLQESGSEPRLKLALGESLRRVSEGSLISDALRKHPRIFSPFVCGLIAVGESTGGFDEVLDRCATLLERDSERSSRVRATLIYPCFLVLASLVMLAAMLLVFLPRMAEVLRSLGGEQPLSLRILLTLGSLLGNPTVSIGLVVASLELALGAFLWLRTREGRDWLDRTVLRLPVLRRVFLALILTRLSFALELVLRCGMPLTSSLGLIADSLGNRFVGRWLLEARERVAEGLTLAEALAGPDSPLPPLFLTLVDVGEESSRLEILMRHAQRIYGEEMDHYLETGMALLEPAILLIMGILVGAMVIAFMLPIAHMIGRL